MIYYDFYIGMRIFLLGIEISQFHQNRYYDHFLLIFGIPTGWQHFRTLFLY